MYITPEYTWSETTSSLTISLSIRNITPSKLSLSIYDNYIKLNYMNYYLCIDLKERIEMEVNVKITSEKMEVVCRKEREGLWEDLVVRNLSKLKVQERRLEATLRKEKVEEEKETKMKKVKEEMNKHALHTQWSVENDYKTKLENIEKSDKLNAENDLYNWLDNKDNNIDKTAPSKTTSNSSDILNKLLNNEKIDVISNNSEDSNSEDSNSDDLNTDDSNETKTPLKRKISWSADLSHTKTYVKGSSIYKQTDNESDKIQRVRKNKGKKKTVRVKNDLPVKSSQSTPPINSNPDRVLKSALKGSAGVSPIINNNFDREVKEIFTSNNGGVTIEEISDSEDERKIDKINENRDRFDWSKFDGDEKNEFNSPKLVSNSKDIFDDIDSKESESKSSTSSFSANLASNFSKFTSNPNPNAFKNTKHPIRGSGVISTSFTETVTKGPARASNAALVKGPEVNNETDPSQSPLFLKEKGDGLLAQGQFLPAISAYSSALAVDPNYVQALANKTVAWMKVWDETLNGDGLNYVFALENCITDSTKALELTKDNQDFIKMRLKLFLRRSAAYLSMGKLELSLSDLNNAKEAEDSKSIADQIELLQSLIEDYKAKKHISFKSEGDLLYKNKNVTEAVIKYTSSLTLDPSYIPSLSNRASAYIFATNYSAAICDLNIALSFVGKALKTLDDARVAMDKEEEVKRKEKAEAGQLHDFIDHNKDKLTKKIDSEYLTNTNLKVRLLGKRATCYENLNRLFDAKRDYEMNMGLNPQDQEWITKVSKINLKIRNQSISKPMEKPIEVSNPEKALKTIKPFDSSNKTVNSINHEDNDSDNKLNVVFQKPESNKALASSNNNDINIDSLMNEAKEYFLKNNFDAALAAYSAIYSYAPLNYNALLNRSLCYYELSEFNKCIDDCNTVLKICDDPMNQLISLLRRGACLIKNNNKVAFLEDYNNALVLMKSKPKDKVSAEEIKSVEDDIFKCNL